jgi:hypothetical protein
MLFDPGGFHAVSFAPAFTFRKMYPAYRLRSVALSARRRPRRSQELLLPAIENGGLQAKFIAELRDWLIFQQMPPQDGDLFFRRVVLPLLLHAFSPLPY